MSNNKQRWALLAGVASLVGAQLAEQLLTSSWRLVARRDPPDDLGYDDVDWRSAVAWAVATGALVALSQLAARQGASVAWKRVTGRRPPQAHKRKRARTRKAALLQ